MFYNSAQHKFQTPDRRHLGERLNTRGRNARSRTASVNAAGFDEPAGDITAIVAYGQIRNRERGQSRLPIYDHLSVSNISTTPLDDDPETNDSNGARGPAPLNTRNGVNAQVADRHGPASKAFVAISDGNIDQGRNQNSISSPGILAASSALPRQKAVIEDAEKIPSRGRLGEQNVAGGSRSFASEDNEGMLLQENFGKHEKDYGFENLVALSELPCAGPSSDDVKTMPSQDYQTHHYQDLPTDCIRLLRILPDSTSEVIRCEMRHFVLEPKLKYAALSYAWGRGPDSERVLVNEVNMRIRKNLWRFLFQARATISDRFDWLWIDAICINQNDKRERMHQVKLMAQIFQAASCVLIWLGPSYGGSEHALDFLSRRRTSRSTRSAPYTNAGKVASIGIVALCYRRYWRRLWILQEIILAKCIWMMCGARISPWQSFRDFLVRLREYGTDATSTLPRHPRLEGGFELTSMPNSPAMAIVTLVEQRTGGHNLHDLLYETRLLRCADQLDKVYALLSIAEMSHCDILPDYDTTLLDLLNAVIRGYHEAQLPLNLDAVVVQCRALEKLFDLQPDTMFKTADRLDTSSEVLAPAEPRSHFGPPNTPITWWWIQSHGHYLVEGAFWREFLPDLLRFYFQAAEAGDLAALQILFNRAELGARFEGDVTRSHALTPEETQVHVALVRSHGDAASKGPDSVAFNKWVYRHMRENKREILWNTLRGAASGGHYTIVKALIDLGARLDPAADEWPRSLMGIDSALIWAARKGHFAIIKLLLDHGADVNSISSDRSPLQMAAAHGHLEVAELLLARGAATSGSSQEESSLSLAAKHGQLEITKLLLDHGAGALEHERNTALESAVRHNHMEVVKHLLDHGANVTCEDALVLQSRAGNTSMVRRILQKIDGAYKIPSNAKQLPLSLQDAFNRICMESGKRVVKILLRSSLLASLHIYARRMTLGEAMLHAADRRRWDNVRLLIKRGADLDMYLDEYTVLHMAVRCNERDVVELLLERGVNVRQACKNEGNMTAIEIAREDGRKDIERLIRNHDDFYRTKYALATFYGDPEGTRRAPQRSDSGTRSRASSNGASSGFAVPLRAPRRSGSRPRSRGSSNGAGSGFRVPLTRSAVQGCESPAKSPAESSAESPAESLAESSDWEMSDDSDHGSLFSKDLFQRTEQPASTKPLGTLQPTRRQSL
jgi:ankyrin repeat protein